MITRRATGVLVAVAAFLGGLAGGAGAAVHAAATTVLALGAVAVAARITPSVPVPRAAGTPAASERAPPAHLVPDLLLAGYARRRGRDVHTRLRPQLRRIAADLLTARHGLSLDDPRHGDAIEDIVGTDAWDLIRPGRPAPTGRRESGLDRRSLEAVLAGLERL